jgi:hypothetical protein
MPVLLFYFAWLSLLPSCFLPLSPLLPMLSDFHLNAAMLAFASGHARSLDVT